MTKPLTVEQLRCLELSAIIREGLEGVKFDMSGWCFTDAAACGSAGCIAGHTCAVYDKAKWKPGFGCEIYESARSLLGLSDEQATELFMPWEIGGPVAGDITPAMAADTLDRLAMTGKVVWE